MAADVVREVRPLGHPWEGFDPFLFCVHHKDDYPAGNAELGPAASLEGRRIGQDFEGKDGWRMYHGDVVPGFPQHPHRGFETVTVIQHGGHIDHFDSLGATARFGAGDAQWLTAGRGIVHAEMFPLVNAQGRNPIEFFQIWVNLPAEDKLVEPHFTMLWSRTIPDYVFRDAAGRRTVVRLVAGRIDDAEAPPPPPRSWAARPDTDFAIWPIRMEPGARWTLPAAGAGAARTLYFFRGGALGLEGHAVPAPSLVRLRPDAEVSLENADQEAEMLLLQARPIHEPVAQYGPFVMNSQSEIQQAFLDYRRTGFGGWPWPGDGPVHARSEGRHARYPDGRIERVD